MAYMRGVIPTVSHGASHLFSFGNQCGASTECDAVTSLIFLHLELQRVYAIYSVLMPFNTYQTVVWTHTERAPRSAIMCQILTSLVQC